jgi:hypothetical protein
MIIYLLEELVGAAIENEWEGYDTNKEWVRDVFCSEK